MAEVDEVKIEIGFDGGQGVTITADVGEWKKLQDVLNEQDRGWVRVEDKGGASYVVAVHKAVYARVVEHVRSIGFAN